MEDERVGNQQRNQVLELLGAALEQGYLTLDEYEQRMAAVSAAMTVSALHSQVADLPPQFRWDPRPGAQRPATGPVRQPLTEEKARTFAITALVFGIASIPLTVCFVGWLFGIAAIGFSIPGVKGTGSWGKAFAGRVLGILGIIFELGFVALVIVSQMAKPAP
ncbi:DUF1707 domain-containing protein [Planosporangium flavigriseum]|uniref:DUF1707 domain-containing protein n=1 Tax=Planosporangium flavigriseum TaxID=373681 RepID=A0A8J3LJT3_9ACTN|nr:DUF1707 domain-containing protein [Planosporangium flavigriseum]NJC66987.1 DUF1707 domain-containing protein [Planosporangium flavigriseum]GIG73947.1 hypothetical protein Pfl04_23510 [Planosporangium flavigriseum]